MTSTSHIRWRFILAIVFGVWLALYLLGDNRDVRAEQLGERVRSGHIIATGLIVKDVHHPNFRVIGGVVVVVHPDGIPAQLIAMYEGKRVELVMREVK